MLNILKEQKLIQSNKTLLQKLQKHLSIDHTQLNEEQILNEFCLSFFSSKFEDLFFIKQYRYIMEFGIYNCEMAMINFKKEQDINYCKSNIENINKELINSDQFVSVLTLEILQNGTKKLLKNLHSLLDIDNKSLSLNQLLEFISQSLFSKSFEEAQKTIFINNKFKTMESASLSFEYCNDSVLFSFKENILQLIFGEFHFFNNHFLLQNFFSEYNYNKIFNIIDVKEVCINNVLHTVLTSSENDTFYIVNNQFHREDDEPAICIKDVQLWLKNGVYHRENEKPSICLNIKKLINLNLLQKNKNKHKKRSRSSKNVFNSRKNKKVTNVSYEAFIWAKNGEFYTPSFLGQNTYFSKHIESVHPNIILNEKKLRQSLK